MFTIALIITLTVVYAASRFGERFVDNSWENYDYPNGLPFEEDPDYPMELGRVDCVFPTQQEILLGKETLERIEAESLRKTQQEEQENH